MFDRFLPVETCFFDFFEQHAEILVRAGKELHLIFSSETSFQFRDTQQFKKWENQADSLVHDCVEALHRTFITPIQREDILRLISAMDNIMDYIEETFDCLVIYKIDKTNSELKAMSGILLQATEKVSLISQGLRNMKNSDLIKENCRAIRQLEREGDETLRAAIGNLFDEEQSTRMVIKMKEIYENLEAGIDSCHQVANITEGIVLECI